MKIAIIHYAGPAVVGGVEAVIGQHVKLFSNDGHIVSVIAGRGADCEGAAKTINLPLIDSRSEEVLQVKAELDRGVVSDRFHHLKELIVSKLSECLVDVDLVIAHNICSLHKNLPLTAALQQIWAARPKWRLWLWHHDFAWIAERYKSELYDGFPWSLLRESWSDVEQIVVSQQRCKELADLMSFDRQRVRVIGNGVDIPSFLKMEPFSADLMHKLSLESAAPLMLLPVRITRRKNIELALRTVAALANSFPKVTLVVTGPPGAHNPDNDNYFSQLKKIRHELHLENRVIFLAEHAKEPLPMSVISDFFRLADLLFLPSFEEGFGIPLLEAALQHIPVFCSDIEVLREVGEGVVAYFNVNSTPEQIAEQIEAKLRSDDCFKYASFVRQNRSWNQIYKNIIKPLLSYGTKEN